MARPLDGFEDVDHVSVTQIAVGAEVYLDSFSLRGTFKFAEAVQQLLHGQGFLFELDDFRFIDMYNFGEVIHFDFRRFHFRRRHVNAVFQQRRGNHENDQQKKHRIHQRCDVDLVKCLVLKTPPHGRSPLFPGTYRYCRHR